jgi:alginate O-acetyltransferase complex protein AlgJ
MLEAISLSQGRQRGSSRRHILRAAMAGLTLAPLGARAQPESAIRGRDGWLFAPWERLDRVDLTNIPRVCEIIGEAMRMIRAAGIEVVLALIPSKAIIYLDMLPPEMTPSREALGRYALIHRTLQEQRAGWLPDLLSPMLQARAARPDQRLFFRADTHWTAAGAELCASEVARFIRDQIPLPPAPGPGERLGPPVLRTRTRADLLPFLPAVERRQYPPEEYLIRPPVRTGNAGLVAEDRADVMALGSSFLAPEFNFSPALSAGLGRPIALEWRVANIGPYATLTGYLGSQLFRRQAPRLLVMSLLEQPMVLLPGNRAAFPEHAMSADSFLERVRQALAAR